MKKIDLLVIDPQNDFCDPKGNLYVGGAEKDMDRLAVFLDTYASKLNEVHVTLDSHQELHIAHPAFWRDKNGKPPAPFTGITRADFKNRLYVPALPSLEKLADHYLETLEKNNRYILTIWPPHCIIGTPGHNVYPSFAASLKNYAISQFATINYVTKGSNPFTEHYSAVQADVPDDNDDSTKINTTFLSTLQSADILLIAGEALSHCVANTVRDACNYFQDDSLAKKIVLLSDATSRVTHPVVAVDDIFAKMTSDFLAEMKGRGMKTATTKDFF